MNDLQIYNPEVLIWRHEWEKPLAFVYLVYNYFSGYFAVSFFLLSFLSPNTYRASSMWQIYLQRIPWAEEPLGLQFMGLQGSGHD